MVKKFAWHKRGTMVLTCAMAVVVTTSLMPMTAVATTAPGHQGTTSAASERATPYRQLLGTITTKPVIFEASVPVRGTYLFEYEVTGLAYFDTYVDGTELGYVGGSTGTYQTRTVQLSAGGHLVDAVGPHGNGTARIYIVQIP